MPEIIIQWLTPGLMSGLDVTELGYCGYCGHPVFEAPNGQVLTVSWISRCGTYAKADGDDRCPELDYHSMPGEMPDAGERRTQLRGMVERAGIAAELTRIASMRVAISMQATGLPVPEPEVV